MMHAALIVEEESALDFMADYDPLEIGKRIMAQFPEYSYNEVPYQEKPGSLRFWTRKVHRPRDGTFESYCVMDVYAREKRYDWKVNFSIRAKRKSSVGDNHFPISLAGDRMIQVDELAAFMPKLNTLVDIPWTEEAVERWANELGFDYRAVTDKWTDM